MKWNIDFDVVAFFIILITFILYSSYRQITTRTKRIYRLLLIMSLVSASMEITSAAVDFYWGVKCITAHYAVRTVHFLVQVFVPALYFIFIYSTVYEAERLTKKRILVFLLPYIAVALPSLTTPLTHFAFCFDCAGNYFRCKGQIAAYISAALYLIMSSIVILRAAPHISRLQKAAVLFCAAETIILSAVQILYPSYLLEEIAIAFAMLSIYLTMQNPLEYVDSEMDAYNRKWFLKVVSNFIADNTDFSLICIQIEGLSYVNEKFGMERGTALAARVPHFLQKLYPSGTIFRLRTARFAVIIKGNADMSTLNNAVIERFNRPFKINAVDIKLRAYMCSIVSSAQGGSVSEIIDTMNYSINEAYSNKKNNIVTADKKLLVRMHRKMNVEQAISDAVERRSFEVFYQPIFDVEQGRFLHAEALVRLQDPLIGRIPADEFISAAEKNGDIIAIGEIVLEKVCQFIQTHRPEQYGIKTIHINLSVVQCMQEHIFDTLLRIIDAHGIAHNMVVFEITETAAVISGDQLKILMQRLNETGIHCALDDFGTGYSNQASIMDYPYSTIKLDKSLVRAAENNDKASVSLKHTIAMINDWNMNTLAEGVETETQAQRLIQMGCRLFQGYLYSPPVPETEFLNILKRTAADAAHKTSEA